MYSAPYMYKQGLRGGGGGGGGRGPQLMSPPLLVIGAFLAEMANALFVHPISHPYSATGL